MEQSDARYDCAVVRVGVSDTKCERRQIFNIGASGGVYDGGKYNIYSDGSGGVRDKQRRRISDWGGFGGGDVCLVMRL